MHLLAYCSRLLGANIRMPTPSSGPKQTFEPKNPLENLASLSPTDIASEVLTSIVLEAIFGSRERGVSRAEVAELLEDLEKKIAQQIKLAVQAIQEWHTQADFRRVEYAAWDLRKYLGTTEEKRFIFHVIEKGESFLSDFDSLPQIARAAFLPSHATAVSLVVAAHAANGNREAAAEFANHQKGKAQSYAAFLAEFRRSLNSEISWSLDYNSYVGPPSKGWYTGRFVTADGKPHEKQTEIPVSEPASVTKERCATLRSVYEEERRVIVESDVTTFMAQPPIALALKTVNQWSDGV
jgi:hypothetical protein